MYDGAMSKYCTNEVIICHGSNFSFVSNKTQKSQTTHKDQTRKNVQSQSSDQTQHNIPKNRVREKVGESQYSLLFLSQLVKTFERQQERRDGHVDRDKGKTDES